MEQCPDKEMPAEKAVAFLANINTCTVFISMADALKFAAALGYDYAVSNCKTPALFKFEQQFRLDIKRV